MEIVIYRKSIHPLSAIFFSSSSGSQGGEIDTQRVGAAFKCINQVGMDTVLDLCRRKLDSLMNVGEKSTDTKSELCIDSSVKLDWLIDLNEASVKKIMESIDVLQDQKFAILSAFKPNAARNQTIELLQKDWIIKNESYQLVACVGEVFLKKVNDPDDKLVLMSVAEFLNTCRKDLQGLDLSKLDLRGMNLSDLDLRDIDFTDAIMNGVNLSGSNLVGAILKRTHLRKANLSKADLHDCNLEGVILNNAILIGAILRNVNFEKARLHKADMTKADLMLARFKEADMRRVILHKADLRGATLCGVNLCEAIITHALLGGADMRNAMLAYAKMSYSDLSWASLENANLIQVSFISAYLGMTNLRGAKMHFADLTEANLSRTIMCGTVLHNASLISVILIDTEFDCTTVLEGAKIVLNLSSEWSKLPMSIRMDQTARLYSIINKINTEKYQSLQEAVKAEIFRALQARTISDDMSFSFAMSRKY